MILLGILYTTEGRPKAALAGDCSRDQAAPPSMRCSANVISRRVAPAGAASGGSLRRRSHKLPSLLKLPLAAFRVVLFDL